MNNELPPIEARGPGDWQRIGEALTEYPDKIQPVYIVHPSTGEIMGDLFASFVEVDEVEYLQIEGFSNKLIEDAFMLVYEGVYTKVQTGMYRLKLRKDYLK